MKTFLLFALVILTGKFATAGMIHLNDATLIKYIPENLKKDPSTGETLTYKQGIGAIAFEAHLDKGDKPPYTIIMYNTDMDCSLIVLKGIKGAYHLQGNTQLKFPTELKGCIDLEEKDLDGDGKPEIIVDTLDGRAPSSPAILKWDGTKLVDISPVIAKNGQLERNFRIVTIADKPVNGKLLIFDYDQYDTSAYRRVFDMSEGEIKLEGTYDFISLFHGTSPTTVKPTFTSSGQYTLNMKNISDHSRAVRAEVTVNGSVVLKPQDFCESPQPKKSDSAKWKGNDDNDDNDEDHCKRCEPKKDVYAVVNLKTSNEIKVKIYGRQDSALELTLVKKPF